MVDLRRQGPPGLQTRRTQVVGLQVGGVLPDRHQTPTAGQDPRHGQTQDRGQVMTHSPPVPRIGHIPKNLPQGLARGGTRGGRWHSGATPRDRGLIRHRLSSRRGRAAPPSTRRKPRTSDNRPPTLPTPWIPARSAFVADLDTPPPRVATGAPPAPRRHPQITFMASELIRTADVEVGVSGPRPPRRRTQGLLLRARHRGGRPRARARAGPPGGTYFRRYSAVPVEPRIGFEPMTCCLQDSRSTD